MLNGGHALPASYPAMSNNFGIPHPADIHNLYKRELPASQESYASGAASSTFAAPTLLSSSSNISNSTGGETDLTSLSPSRILAPAPSIQSPIAQKVVPPSPTRARAQHVQTTAPRIDTAIAQQTGNTAASPMSLESPGLNHGSKRTASGIIKTADTVVHSPTAAPSAPSAHKRTKSTGSNTRIGELSAQLKTRLSYAMIKVQNGWEKQSLEELEDQTSQRGSPSSAPAATERLTFESPRPTMRRPSGVSDSDFPMMSPGQGSPSYLGLPHAAVTSAAWPAGTYAVSPLGKGNGPVLAPPAEIGPRRKRRSSASHAPPPLLGSGQRKHYSDLGSMSAPRTPTSTSTPRAGILRMPSQQAEKDAVDTLLFMSSPNNSGRIPHTSADAQPSPLRTEVSTRRVMFDHTAQERYMASQSQHLGPNGQPAPQ